jgi:hypothetical protein
LYGPVRLLKISRKAGDVSNETIISQNERPTREACFDGDEYIIAIDGEIAATDLIRRDFLLPPRGRFHIREDPPVEKVTLIGGELVSISYEFQGSLSGIGSIEKVAKVL